jgi:HTH-type transcriptional regulator, sugar sensing transcriptional regulator
MDINLLKELGLTDSEVNVFITLLKIGPAKAGDIIDKSQLQNPVVHRAFHSLIEKGIITYSFSGKIKYYQAIDPSLLLNLIDEKKRRLESIIPELKGLYSIKREKTKATIHQGVRGVRELLNYLLENCDKEFLTYGAPKKSLDLLEDFFWKGFHNKRLKKRVFSRMIFHDSLLSRVKELNKLPMTNVRTTNKDFEELVETIIAGNKVGIIVYLDDPIGILIEEELAAKSYRNFFELIWKSCK